MIMDPMRMLGANLRIAMNLECEKRRQEQRKLWIALEERADAMGCDLVWDEDGPLIYDRDRQVIDIIGMADEDSQEYPMALHFVEQLEKNGGRL